MFPLFKFAVGIDSFGGRWSRQLQRLGRISRAYFIAVGFSKASLCAPQAYLCCLHLSAHPC